VLLATLLAGCGSGGGDTGNSGNPGDPGSGGGPGEPGGSGNPLAVVLDFSVDNDAATARTETICASVPFPRGGYPSLANLVVSGHQTAWLPLQHWPDGTVRVAQAQFTDTLAANETKTYRVARDEPALGGAFARNAWVSQMAGNLQFGAQVRDTFNVAYRAFASGAGTVLQETPLVQTRRWRTYHTVVPGQTGMGRDFLASTFYTTEYRDMPFIVVDWIVGNDYLGADTIPTGNTDPNLRPLGRIDVNEARFLCRNMTAVQPYRPAEEAIAAAQVLPDGYTSFQVMQDTWLEDAQTRRYRFLLRFEPPNANAIDLQRWRDTANAMLQLPVYPLASHRAWLETSAAGLLGGPLAGPPDAATRAAGEHQSWAAANHFGTWGSRSDAVKTGTTGTPRNGPLSPEFAHAVQSQHHRLVQKLEQMAWAQAMRPYHLFGLTVGAEQDILLWDGVPIYPGSRDLSRESLGRRGLWANDPYPQYRTRVVTGGDRAHGWEHFDHEHWTTDLLFDYWTLSGDAWAREELRQLGQSLKGVMRVLRYTTANVQAARAEGWTMQSFVQCYLATGDQSLKDYALRRTRDVVDAQRHKTHPSKALTFQNNYTGTGFPLDHRFYMPWQHGAVLYGFLGAYRFFQDPVYLEIAEDVVDCVQYSWVTNFQDPVRGLVPNGLRYYTPVEFNGTPIPANFWDLDPNIGVKWGDSPLGGAHIFLIGGLYQLIDMTTDQGVRNRAFQYATAFGPIDNNSRWSKWRFCVPPRFVQ
jgi:hypothetical protein